MKTVQDLIAAIQRNDASYQFSEVMAVIDANFKFTPTAFKNGDVSNAAGENNGSCKVFAFGQLQQLTAPQTLALFAEHYRSVLDTPTGTDHQNIRNFIKHGWAGIQFEGSALTEQDK
ncbi:HopJ type III effector protein [Neiella marina]|uniref:HopJ type III effector protein n=1 Tax=Neiella holothuriorum TaxID=2870530 RepID=A0ABS7EFR1_9GAMM|nr:HopJ type III effector protein [Neiella holothuriorum]MBW8190522.1 HopJ type III effector protein [Neiella holothuriorum]